MLALNFNKKNAYVIEELSGIEFFLSPAMSEFIYNRKMDKTCGYIDRDIDFCSAMNSKLSPSLRALLSTVSSELFK